MSEKTNKQWKQNRDWRGGSVVKGSCCSFRGHEFDSQHPCQVVRTTCDFSSSRSSFLYWHPQASTHWHYHIHREKEKKKQKIQLNRPPPLSKFWHYKCAPSHLVYVVLGIKSRPWCVLGKHSTRKALSLATNRIFRLVICLFLHTV